MKIAIIGAGNMGGAIAKGLAQGTVIAAGDIWVSNPSLSKLDDLKRSIPVSIRQPTIKKPSMLPIG